MRKGGVAVIEGEINSQCEYNKMKERKKRKPEELLQERNGTTQVSNEAVHVLNPMQPTCEGKKKKKKKSSEEILKVHDTTDAIQKEEERSEELLKVQEEVNAPNQVQCTFEGKKRKNKRSSQELPTLQETTEVSKEVHFSNPAECRFEVTKGKSEHLAAVQETTEVGKEDAHVSNPAPFQKKKHGKKRVEELLKIQKTTVSKEKENSQELLKVQDMTEVSRKVHVSNPAQSRSEGPKGKKKRKSEEIRNVRETSVSKADVGKTEVLLEVQETTEVSKDVHFANLAQSISVGKRGRKNKKSEELLKLQVTTSSQVDEGKPEELLEVQDTTKVSKAVHVGNAEQSRSAGKKKNKKGKSEVQETDVSKEFHVANATEVIYQGVEEKRKRKLEELLEVITTVLKEDEGKPEEQLAVLETTEVTKEVKFSTPEKSLSEGKKGKRKGKSERHCMAHVTTISEVDERKSEELLEVQGMTDVSRQVHVAHPVQNGSDGKKGKKKRKLEELLEVITTVIKDDKRKPEELLEVLETTEVTKEVKFATPEQTLSQGKKAKKKRKSEGQHKAQVTIISEVDARKPEELLEVQEMTEVSRQVHVAHPVQNRSDGKKGKKDRKSEVVLISTKDEGELQEVQETAEVCKEIRVANAMQSRSKGKIGKKKTKEELLKVKATTVSREDEGKPPELPESQKITEGSQEVHITNSTQNRFEGKKEKKKRKSEDPFKLQETSISKEEEKPEQLQKVQDAADLCKEEVHVLIPVQGQKSKAEQLLNSTKVIEEEERKSDELLHAQGRTKVSKEEEGHASNPAKRKKTSHGETKDFPSVRLFQRINVDEVEYADPRLQNNSYWAKLGADEGWGAKAQEVLGQVKGKGFRHEKTKKKRGSYRGGIIDHESHSIKFNYSDDE